MHGALHREYFEENALTNLTQRVLTALVAIPVILLLCVLGGWYFFIFTAVLSTLALSEFYSLAAAKGAKPLTLAGSAAGVAVNCAFFSSQLRNAVSGALDSAGISFPFPSGDQLVVIIIVLGVALLSIRELFRNDGSAILNLSTTLFGVMYVALFFGTWIGIREMFTSVDPPVAHHFLMRGLDTGERAIYAFGGATVISVFAMIWICDSAAFHVGRSIGKHKLFPRVSPNKSWEGAIAGFLGAIAAAVAARYLVLGYLSLPQAVMLGAIVGTVGQLGDLLESLLKRDAGVKDSSNLIPGHGGVLDRFDSLLLVSPVVYLYLDFIVF